MSAPGCLVVQNGRPHQGEGIAKLPLLSFKKVFGDDSNTVSLGSVSAAQRLKPRKKKGFGEESGTEVMAMTPKLFEELMRFPELVTWMKGQLWSDGCPCSGWLLVKFSPFWGSVSLVVV